MVGLDYLIFVNEGSNLIVSALDKGTRPLRSLSEMLVGTGMRLGKLRDLGKKAQ